MAVEQVLNGVKAFAEQVLNSNAGQYIGRSVVVIKATASEFIGKSTIVGKTVAIIQANPIPVVAAIILIAALIIGYKCYKSYSSFKSQLAEKDQKIKDITGNLNGTEKALDEKSRELLKTEKRLKETEKNAETLKAESARLNNIKINEASELNKNLQAKVKNFGNCS